jgi:hypothetical protein
VLTPSVFQTSTDLAEVADGTGFAPSSYGNFEAQPIVNNVEASAMNQYHNPSSTKPASSLQTDAIAAALLGALLLIKWGPQASLLGAAVASILAIINALVFSRR